MPNLWKAEAKVVASTLASAATGAVIGVLNDVETNNTLLDPIPHALQIVMLVAIPTAVTFLAGWRAKHTPRPDIQR